MESDFKEAVNAQLEVSLASLKDFQQATVESLVAKFSDPEHSHRMLVADEVGLGKTIVAKGVIAKLLQQHLSSWSTTATGNQRPFRVTYICSNLALADENRQKLAVFGKNEAKRWVKQPSFRRLIELAAISRTPDNEEGKVIEVCTLTPATSFTLTLGSGNCWERVIIANVVASAPQIEHVKEPLLALFKTNHVGAERWKNELDKLSKYYDLSDNICFAVHNQLNQPCTSWRLKEHYASRLEAINELCGQWLEDEAETEQTKSLFYALRVELRRLVAQSCAGNLEADLFILDEFQRFQSLTNPSDDSEESIIARQVFKSDSNQRHSEYKSKVLLLSATPFKAVTTLHDDENGASHHEQLHNLLDFISANDVDFIDSYEQSRDQLQKDLLSLTDPNKPVDLLEKGNSQKVEALLRRFICRTERSQISDGFDDIYDSSELICNQTLNIDEVKAFQALDAINSAIGQYSRTQTGGQLLEFSKSAPWVMSFLQGYVFKKQFLNHLDKPEVKQLLKDDSSANQFAWLRRGKIDNHTLDIARETPNARVREMTKTVFKGNGEHLLWVPPSKPNYRPTGVYENSNSFTKSLIFSAWAMVPRVLSGIWSYEAERRVVSGAEEKESYFSSKKHTPLLRFYGTAPLNNWALLYPSKFLQSFKFNSETLSSELEARSVVIADKLLDLKRFESSEGTGAEWYLLAPMLLDREHGLEGHIDAWLSVNKTPISVEDDTEGDEAQGPSKGTGRLEHLAQIEAFISQGESLVLGPMPEDLADILALLSVASPAVCALRTIEKHWGHANCDEQMKFCVSFSNVTIKLFNHEYAKPIVQQAATSQIFVGSKTAAWLQVLDYCAQGNFQAMLDEYCHLLSTSGSSLESAYSKLLTAMGIRSTPVHAHFWENRFNDKQEQSSLRCHYAVPLGTQKMTDDKGLSRVVNIRDAFNSPFRPFVLSSTSIGQEGLDFHWYCSRVIHWNLPRNPIDIEQREGRVNRFKSLVVRKRLAEVFAGDIDLNGDIWQQMFEAAEVTQSNRSSDLEPYWFYPYGSAKIERIVPMYPMSKEVQKLNESLKILALYRLAFGQPRQQELLENLLHRNLTAEEIEKVKSSLIINLAPLKRKAEVDKAFTADCEVEAL
ncbi:DEAD/DEAH box helicase [Photobacterium satsumensis]|uniref:C-terminal helicase domain-containing protein n=1 Tax=Photobacterium satsumensis TaxID=2910239 RepID=UPI003D1352E2